MFWIILLCHFIADYPLQSDAMVSAKRTLSGLSMHVAIHFSTMLVVLGGFLEIEASVVLSLAFAISCFHFIIDYWKNILSNLRPTWIIFAYIQDQILHYASIMLVAYIWQRTWPSFLQMDITIIIYSIGFIVATHFWFVTERVLCYKYTSHSQWVGKTMWSRMMSRGILFCTLVSGLNLWLLAIISGAILVSWNDLDASKRKQTFAMDFFGVTILILITLGISRSLF